MKDDKATLAQLMVRECGGLIGALRVGVNILEQEFLLNPTPSELELALTFLSHRCRKNMGRCFGKPATPTNSKFRGFLAKCLAMAPAAVPLKRKLANGDRRCIVDLMKSGVIVQEIGQMVQLSSPVAERFYFYWLVLECAGWDPNSLHDLVMMVLGSMSAKTLLASAGKTGGMPDEVTFRQEVMRGIAVNTFETCSICPELPRVFPLSTPGRNELGRMVVFVGAMEVDGHDSQDYSSGFAPGGRYAALEVDDYAVLDLRGNANGDGTIPATVTLKEEVITVFFKLGDFSRCQCVLGMNETRRDINLS